MAAAARHLLRCCARANPQALAGQQLCSLHSLTALRFASTWQPPAGEIFHIEASARSLCPSPVGNVPSLVAFGFAARGISSSRSTLDVSTGVATTSSFSKNPLQQLPLSGGDAEDDPESRAVGPREAVCHKRGIRISPRKLNMAAKLVRKMHVKDALINMSIRREKKSANIVKEAIRSAYFNAINNHNMDASKLTVAECFVGKGRYLRMTSVHGMGKSGTMHKYRAHLTVRLKEDENVTPMTRVVRPLAERRAGSGKASSEPRWVP